MTLPKANRLGNDNRVNEILKNGKRVVIPYFVAYSLPNDLNTYRVCLRVSRKIGDANIRNKMKRLVKEIFRQNPNAFSNNDYVLILRKRPPDINIEAMEKILTQIPGHKT